MFSIHRQNDVDMLFKKCPTTKNKSLICVCGENNLILGQQNSLSTILITILLHIRKYIQLFAST